MFYRLVASLSARIRHTSAFLTNARIQIWDPLPIIDFVMLFLSDLRQQEPPPPPPPRTMRKKNLIRAWFYTSIHAVLVHWAIGTCTPVRKIADDCACGLVFVSKQIINSVPSRVYSRNSAMRFSCLITTK